MAQLTLNTLIDEREQLIAKIESVSIYKKRLAALERLIIQYGEDENGQLEETELFGCSQCGRQFNTKQGLGKHRTSKHGGKK